MSNTNERIAEASASICTTTWLDKAKAGEIPVNVLEKVLLDKQDVIHFVAGSLPILKSSAKGAGMATLAMFFDELESVLHQA
jgi:hypothetical protein